MASEPDEDGELTDENLLLIKTILEKAEAGQAGMALMSGFVADKFNKSESAAAQMHKFLYPDRPMTGFTPFLKKSKTKNQCMRECHRPGILKIIPLPLLCHALSKEKWQRKIVFEFPGKTTTGNIKNWKGRKFFENGRQYREKI